MRQRIIIIVAVLLAAGLLGAYLVAMAQEAPVPWPPPPVKIDAGRTDVPPIPPSATPNGNTPAPAEPKKPVTDTTPGPVRKWFSGLVPASAQDAGKPKSGLQQVGHKETGQELPPPIPPKLTVDPAAPPALPPTADNQFRTAPPPPLPSDLPPIPMPNLPPALSPTEQKPAAPEPMVVLPTAPAFPAQMPAPDAPKVDPVKSVITEPVQQMPAPQSGQPKNVGQLPLVTIPAEAPAAGNPSAGLPLPAEPPTVPRTPAFVLINARKTDNIASSVTSPPIAPSPPPTGQGAPRSWPAPPPPNESLIAMVHDHDAHDPMATVLGVQTPPITVEKRGLRIPVRDAPLAFQIIVRNLGTMAAQQVRVEDELPAGAKIIAAEPTPHMQGTRAVWHLNELPAGGTAVLSMSLQPGLSANFSHNTIVHVVGTAAITTAGSAPPAPSAPPVVQQAAALAVQVTAPAGVAMGRPAVFELTYTNQSNQRLTGLVLHVLLSTGLHHPVGQSIEAEVNLEPGASKTIKVEASAVAPGRQSVQVRLNRPGGPDASAQAAVEVGPAAVGLTIQQTPATRVFIGRPNDLRLEVTNNTAKPMRHVSIASYLPDGVDFIAAGDHGNYQPNSRTVNWLVDTLAPGQTQGVLLRIQGKTAGQLPHEVLARADGVPESRSSAILAVEGIADIAVSLQGEPALEIGKEAVYEVRVANPGSGANTNVRVEVTLTPGLLPRNAQGPSPFRIEGQKVIFENLALLMPQGQAIYRVVVVGESPGDRRVGVSVTTDQVRAPATRESGTRVYRD